LSLDRDLDLLVQSRLPDDGPVDAGRVLGDDVDVGLLEDTLRCFDHLLGRSGHRAVERSHHVGGAGGTGSCGDDDAAGEAGQRAESET
jgi:hypothetical protein